MKEEKSGGGGVVLRGSLIREAARILSDLIEAMHVTSEGDRVVNIEARLPVHLFDRLSVWGAAAEEFEEDDPAEDNGDREPENAW